MSLLNWGGGLSAAGSAVAGFAEKAGVAEQKAALERQQLTLADQLATTRETALESQRQQGQKDLVPIQGAEARQTAVATATAQGDETRKTDQYKTTLPMSAVEKATTDAAAKHAEASMLDAKKPTPAGFGQGWLVPSKDDPSGYKVISISGANDLGPPDPTSDNLGKQTGLSEMAIHAATGDLSGRASIPYLNELGNWAAKNNKNIDTIKSQAKAVNEVLKSSSERNALGVIQEREIQGSIETIAPILEDMNAGKINKANVIKILYGQNVNDPTAMKAVDQITRLREELAGYNAIANAKITNGHPNPEVNEIKAANDVIANGINSGSIKAFGQSIAASAEKNREILLKTREDANEQLFSLFGGKYHRQDAATPPPPATPAADASSKLPPGVPSGSQFSPSRKQWRSADGKLYDEYGAPVDAGAK